MLFCQLAEPQTVREHLKGTLKHNTENVLYCIPTSFYDHFNLRTNLLSRLTALVYSDTLAWELV